MKIADFFSKLLLKRKRKNANSKLHAAAKSGNTARIQQLLANGAEINAKADNGTTPLHMAMCKKALEGAKLLINAGADVNAKTDNNITPLHLAVANDVAEVAKLLIEKGAEVNAKTDNGTMPLHMAAFKNAPEVVKLLIDRGADVNAKTNNGETPLQAAVYNNAPEVSKLLIDNGATEKPEQLEEKGVLRFPAVEWAALISGLLFVFSLFWEWGYWSALEISLVEIPLAFEDMADSVIIWLPKSALLFFVIVVYILLTYRIEGFRSEEELLSISPRPIRFMRKYERVMWIVVIVIGICVQAYLYGKIPLILAFLGCMAIWMRFIPWFFNHPRAPKRNAFFYLLYFTPIMCMYFYMAGRSVAEQIITESAQNPAHVFLKEGNGMREKRLILLRNSHEFVYAYDPVEKMIVTLPWPIVDRIATDAIPDSSIRIPFLSRDDGNKEEMEK